MGEETVSQVEEVSANGTASSEKVDEPVAERKEENTQVKEIEEDKNDHQKDENSKMDGEPKVKEDEAIKEDKEEPNTETELMEEETQPKEGEEIEEKEESKEEVEEKVDESKVEEEKEEDDGSKEEEENVEENGEEKVRKKHGKGKSTKKTKTAEGKVVRRNAVEERKEPETRIPASDRPQRERKSVERLVAVIEKDTFRPREFHIQKGCGTPLKDIPNVAFKLSRKKSDDTFKLLHTILFGRRGKAVQVKSNISHFSGFVWHENEEKQKNKVKEKFDKCNKEKLLELCDVLDLPIAKAATKKEDIVTKLIDFLVAPHATTTVLLPEKDMESKNKKRKSGGRASASWSTPSKQSKSQRKADEASEKDKNGTTDMDDESDEERDEEEEEVEEKEKEIEKKEEKDDKEDEEKNEKDEKDEEKIENGVPGKPDTEMPEQSDSEEKEETEKESEEDTKKRRRASKISSSGRKGTAGKAKTGKATVSNESSPPPKRTPKRSLSKRSQAEDDRDVSPKLSSRKKKHGKDVEGQSSTPTKSAFQVKTGYIH